LITITSLNCAFLVVVVVVAKIGNAKNCNKEFETIILHLAIDHLKMQ
jgi:hypothetical protein